eukprot:10796827-Alexandrium_andersonii.AAC.1
MQVRSRPCSHCVKTLKTIECRSAAPQSLQPLWNNDIPSHAVCAERTDTAHTEQLLYKKHTSPWAIAQMSCTVSQPAE